MDLHICKSLLEVQLCMNFLMTQGLGTAKYDEEEVSAHQVMRTAIKRKKDRVIEYLITIDDAEAAQKPVEVEHAHIALQGVSYAVRSAFFEKNVAAFDKKKKSEKEA